jgi:anti-anti-sigma regulatory factor
MTVRITTVVEDCATRISVAGRLTARDVSELDDVCAATQGPLILDVSDLLFADEAGVGELLHLATETDVQLLGISPYVELLLHGSP